MDQHFDAADIREDLDLDAGDDAPRGEGWVKAHRASRRHRLVGMGLPVRPADPKRGAYSRYEAWQDLYMEAAHDGREVRLQGATITLNRGQLAVSFRFLARRWNWTLKAVRCWFPKLKQDRMIAISEGHTPPSQKGTRRDYLCSVITICGYEKYQNVAPRKGTAKGTAPLEKGHKTKNYKNNYSPLPLSEQGERDRLVRDLVALDAPPSPSPDAAEALTAYNAAAEQLGWVPKPSLSPTEARRLETRLREIGGAEAFSRAMRAAPRSRLAGDWSRRMRPDLTYVLSTGTASGDVLQALLDLAAMDDAAPVDAPWWEDEAKRKLVTAAMWRAAIVASVTPEHWDFQNLSYPPDDPRCVVPPEVFDAATIAHCERCGFSIPAAFRLHLAAVDGRAVA